MNGDHFNILLFDLTTGKGERTQVDGRDQVAGGSGLAALLFTRYGQPDASWDSPGQPLIFTIGPLSGYFPLMSKTICAFKSPYHNQYTESHGGGRSAMALRLTGLDALVLIGRSPTLCFFEVSGTHFQVRDCGFLWGQDVFETGKILRRMSKGSGHRSILRIGPAGENGAAIAGINVDTYRHFGRLGGGAAMGVKNLKAIILHGDAILPLPKDNRYSKLFAEVHSQVTDNGMMKKYHDLGTPANLKTLNDLQSLPWRNLQATADEAVDRISGERFADEALLRNSACSGCPVGCIHVGFVREKFMDSHRYLYRQVSYDYETIFSLGTMLGVSDRSAVLTLLDLFEKAGMDAMSAGVALAWATEATEKGFVSVQETLAPLAFGDFAGYQQAASSFGTGANAFYRLLGQGTLKAAEVYGGKDFACVLGQEMAGYATGEVFFAAQALGFRHSHLDSGGYSYDQQHANQDVNAAVEFLVRDEASRAFMTSMVACLFARNVYTDSLLADCLQSLGYKKLAATIPECGRNIQKIRWQTRIAGGFHPESITIPKRFREITTWKGPIDPQYLQALQTEYGQAILSLVGR
ncbi:aldehyde ferredoxin oxidoreductase N-terminal domain-containing protein [uncultured Desulfobulbus sp.]|uniref:aldehyde ferredoxin oxidoreductase N-terminal domain-containing protein n=1 Tax=uncultured Desulfobulbus sp. TaxID=239745 RepID=UPI0029C8169F|nr:aldehyde ferredoxin oxidoreductase C-terminal domain-containing protein [uncultured Desulfobulbus sp.]